MRRRRPGIKTELLLSILPPGDRGRKGRMDLNLQSLQYFLAVVEHKSFSVAAEKNYVSQPTVSHHISMLEQELGVKLFERVNNRTEVTAAGRECADVAQKIFEECGRLKNIAARYANVVAGEFSVGYVNNAAGALAVPRLRQLESRYPLLRISIENARLLAAMEKLQRRELDMIITGEQIVKDKPWIEYQLLRPERLVVVCLEGHPFGKRGSVTFQELAREHVYLRKRRYYPEEYDAIFAEWKSHGAEPERISEEETIEAVLNQIRFGKGVTCVGNGLLRPQLGELRRVPVEDSLWQYGVVAAWRKGEKKPAVERFLQQFEGELGDSKIE